MTFGLIAFAVAWRFLAPDSPQIVAMEWKRVLDSPLSAAVRREIPPAAAPVLASVNFIEGISHAVWTPGLVVLEGSFDLERLKDMARSDGGSVQAYRNAELLAPAEEEGTYVGLVSASLVLLGSEANVKAAIDRSEKQKSSGPTGYDLWVRSSGSDFAKHEFQVQMNQEVRLKSTIRYTSDDAARAAVEKASPFGLTGSQTGAEAAFIGSFSPADFAKRQWRSAIEGLQRSTVSTAQPEPPSSHPGVIRIYGLEGGVKEIPIK